MCTISLGLGSASEAVVTRLLTQTLCFDILRNQAKTKDSCANALQSLSLTLSRSLSLSLYFYDLLSKFANEDRPTCLIRGKHAYQELQSSPTLRPMITEHFRQVPSFRCMPWADPEGGQGVRTPPPPGKSQKYRVP